MRILGGPATLEDAEAAERATIDAQVRQARLEVARRQPKWTEIENDLVPRHGGRWLVSAATDHVYQPTRGVVFQNHSVNVIADQTELSFYVDHDGELVFLERLPGTWSEHIAKQAEKERRRAAPSPRRGRPAA